MYFIGVDSGGSKTFFVLASERGRILARHRSGSGGFISSGQEKIAAMLREGVAALCGQVGIDKRDITAAALGFPGYGEARDSGKVLCECDCYVAWAGSLGMEPGINVVAGTGSVCYGVNAHGMTARSGGWGAYCDEGSCRWLGSRLIQVFTRQSDGRLPRTALYDRFRDHFGLEEDMHFIGPLNHEFGASGTKTAELQVLLKEICRAGDPCAAALYREAAEELWLAIHAVAVKLGIAGGPFRVSYSGGLFRSGECILGPLREYVEAGGGELVAPRFAPELGAVLMAMHKAMPDADFSRLIFIEE